MQEGAALRSSVRWCGLCVALSLLGLSAWAAEYHVRQDGLGDFATVQEAIDAAQDGDTIVVHPGRYVENISFGGKNIVVSSLAPQDAHTVASTVIDGGQSGSVVSFAATEDETCVLCGFTITNGSSVAGGGIAGGSLQTAQTRAAIVRCTIVGNSAKFGGGLFLCAGRIEACLIKDNVAEYGGGGLFGCNGQISDCTVSHNRAEYGGGLYRCNGRISDSLVSANTAKFGGGLYYCDGTLSSCRILDNSADYGAGIAGGEGLLIHSLVLGNEARFNGGGLYRFHGTARNCLVVRNSAKFGGGLYDCWGQITNLTVSGNSAERGPGVCSSSASLMNSIVWGNGVPGQRQLFASTAPTYSCIGNWVCGQQGNISVNPLFVSGPLGDYYLSCYAAGQSQDSPCIDTGSGVCEEFELCNRTTRVDSVPDTGRVDLGFHYPVVDLVASCGLNRQQFAKGSQMQGYLSLTNRGAPVVVDLYLMIVLPDGSAYYLSSDGFSALAAAWASGVSLPKGFSFGPQKVFELRIPNDAVPGCYLYSAVLRASGKKYRLASASALFEVEGD